MFLSLFIQPKLKIRKINDECSVIYGSDLEELIHIKYDNKKQQIKCLKTIEKSIFDIINLFNQANKIYFQDQSKETDIQDSDLELQIKYQEFLQIKLIEKQSPQILYLKIGLLFFEKEDDNLKTDIEEIIKFLFEVQMKYDSPKINEICRQLKEDLMFYQDFQKTDFNSSTDQNPLLEEEPTYEENYSHIKELLITDEIMSRYRGFLKFQQNQQILNNCTYQLINTSKSILMRNDNSCYGYQIQDIQDICCGQKGVFLENKFKRGEIVEFEKYNNQIIHYINLEINENQSKEGKKVTVMYYKILTQNNLLQFQCYKRYSGEFKNNQPNGNGRMEEYSQDKKQRYIGLWVGGLLSQGSYQLEIESEQKFQLYEGQFLNSKFHGQGIIYFNKERSNFTRGRFNQGKKVGMHIKTINGQEFKVLYVCNKKCKCC